MFRKAACSASFRSYAEVFAIFENTAALQHFLQFKPSTYYENKLNKTLEKSIQNSKVLKPYLSSMGIVFLQKQQYTKIFTTQFFDVKEIFLETVKQKFNVIDFQQPL